MLSDFLRACCRVPAGEVLGMNRRNRDLIDQFNPPGLRKLADDKVLGKELLAKHGLPIVKTYAVIDTMRAVAKIKHTVGQLQHFVIKPAHGRAGLGIAVLGPKAQRGWYGPAGELWTERDIRRRLGDIVVGDYANRISDRALIEERIFAGPVLGELPVIGLPDIRIITLEGNPVMAMLRLPTRKSTGKANLHLGAVGLGIDLETGRTTTAIWRHRPVECHPESGQPLCGLQVAAWDRVLETACGAARAFPLRYLGIDIAITSELEPVILEANVRPGLEIQNANRCGLRPNIERVLTGGNGGC